MRPGNPTPDRSAFDDFVAEAMNDPEYAAAARKIECRDRWKLPLIDWLLEVRHLVTLNRVHDWRVGACWRGTSCGCGGTHTYCKVCRKDGQS